MLRVWLWKKKEVLTAALIYFLTILVLLSALYWFLQSNGFDRHNFLIAASGVLLVAFGWGYVLANDLLAPKREMDEKLMHLIREILHELNLPLSTIQANTAMLKKALNDSKSLKRIDRIDGASARLKRLYEELVYTIKKKILPIEKEYFELSKLITERVEILSELQRNPFLLSVSQMTLYADKIGFEQMIDNLLNNAMKYSDKNALIEIWDTDGSLYIRDRGTGIDESKLVRIFERYYQADQNYSGEGIGLALVKEYCDETGLEISIRSKKGEGTTIVIGIGVLLEKK